MTNASLDVHPPRPVSTSPALHIVERFHQPSDEELAELSASFESAPPAKVIAWAVDTFGDRLCLSSSMTDAVLIDIASSVAPGIEVVFVDTGYHFPETLDTVERVRERYDVTFNITAAGGSLDDQWLDDPDGCCAVRKVAPLEAALANKAAWMSGLKREDAPTRADAPIVARDRRGLVKVNPLATWTELDIAGYIADNDVIVNPLVAQGYPSIGCWPCTRAISGGEDKRAGRWTGFEKTECGLHL
ncbi:MAG TPA: phosphoadenylyl-sulfate reductase [Acidimicrobiales bacterium]|jgi:phosphoadenosine phosphosulfate reductase